MPARWPWRIKLYRAMWNDWYSPSPPTIMMNIPIHLYVGDDPLMTFSLSKPKVENFASPGFYALLYQQHSVLGVKLVESFIIRKLTKVVAKTAQQPLHLFFSRFVDQTIQWILISCWHDIEALEVSLCFFSLFFSCCKDY
jgi:hypothetical protein